MSDVTDILDQARALARCRQGRGAGDGGHHLGGRRRDRSAPSSPSRIRAPSSARSRAAAVEGAVVTEGARGDQRRQAAHPRFRRHRRPGPGKSGSPAAARSRSSSSASNEGGAPSRYRHRSGGGTAARWRSRPRLATGRQLLLDGERTEGDLTLDEVTLTALREGAGAPIANTTLATGRRARSSPRSSAPPRRCFVVGAVHIAQPLVRMLTLGRFSPRSSSIRGNPCHRRALSRRHALDRVAGRGAGRDEARPSLGRDHLDPRPPKLDDPGARRGLALRGLLHRGAGLAPDPRQALRAPDRPSASAESDPGAHPRPDRPPDRCRVARRDPRSLDPRARSPRCCAAAPRPEAA